MDLEHVKEYIPQGFLGLLIFTIYFLYKSNQDELKNQISGLKDSLKFQEFTLTDFKKKYKKAVVIIKKMRTKIFFLKESLAKSKEITELLKKEVKEIRDKENKK